MENNYSYPQEIQEKKTSIIGGIVGALLGAVIGAIIWAIVGILTETVFWLIGLGIGAIVAFGYDLFKGRKGIMKIITIVVCVILAVVAGDLAYLTWNINEEYTEFNTLLTTGTNEEIAEYFFTPDAYAEYKTLNVLDQNYNIKLIKDEYKVSNLVEFYQMAYQGNTEFRNAMISDTFKSIAAALFGGLTIAFKAKKKEQDVTPINFDEAALNSDNTSEQTDSTAV